MGKFIMLEEGLSRLEEGIQKAKLILDGYTTNQLFTSEQYMKYYDCVYYMCVQQPPYDYSEQLFERFNTAMEESIFSRVLPSLTGKTGNLLLIELLRMWTNYKSMAKCLGGFFLYLDRKCVDRKNAEPLYAFSVRCFRDLVCKDFYKTIIDAALFLITQDRSAQPIERNLLQSISTFFVEVGGQGETFYYDQFENAILADTANYYSQVASRWLLCYSSTDYILKAEQCLLVQKERASQFLYQSSVEKLLQVVHSQLITETSSKLIEKQKAENLDSTAYQDLLCRCSSLSIG